RAGASRSIRALVPLAATSSVSDPALESRPDMPYAVDSPRVVNISDLRRLAERRLPRAVFDYIDGGADAELTLRENCRVSDDVILRPRNAVAIRSEEHTSELQSRGHLVCRLLLEKKKRYISY